MSFCNETDSTEDNKSKQLHSPYEKGALKLFGEMGGWTELSVRPLPALKLSSTIIMPTADTDRAVALYVLATVLSAFHGSLRKSL